MESNEDVLLYSRGHIPGAVNIDWVADLNDPVIRDYLDREQFEHLMAQNGIANDTRVDLLRRQEQLVGVLCVVGIRVVRPHQQRRHGRRAAEVGARRPAR